MKKKVQLVDALGKHVTNPTRNDVDSSLANDSVDERITLPPGLTQYEFRVTIEEKDTAVYYYLQKNCIGRTLVFVNAIITAKRLDGLLRSLGFNSRTIHGQLEQKQRFRALESFRSAPTGILVATDVAARGLDIPKVSCVMHYDVARSPQVYIHRSGRTARTNKDGAATGTAVSVVSPEDASFHNVILEVIPRASFSTIRADLSLMDQLGKRVKLAKKVKKA